MARLALAGEAYTMRSLAAAAQTCTNLYAEKIEDPNETAKGKAVLFGTPGRHLWKTLTTIDAAATPLRGLWTGGGRLFVFAGSKYFELNSAGALVGSVRTIVNAANNPVQAFGNGNQLLIISDTTVYIDNGLGPVAINIGASAGTVDTNGTLVTWVSGDKFPEGLSWSGKSITINAVVYTIDRVSDSTQLYLTGTAGIQTGVAYSQAGEALTGTTGAYNDKYFFVSRPNSNQVNFSAILDGSNWNGLDFFLKDGYPDHVRSIFANNEQLYAFGEETLQPYQDTGNATTPWQPIKGAMQRYGSCSPWGPIAIDGRVFFLGGSGGGVSAYVLDGFTPKRISTHAIEEQWNSASLGYAAVSYAYLEEGHSFWVINFGTQTWAYDTTTGAWHERKGYALGSFVPATTLYHAYVEWGNGTKQHLTGGGDAKVYDTSVNFYDDNGADIKVQRALPYQFNDGRRMYFGRMNLEAETGAVASGAEPVVSRDYSDDRGQTFSTPVDAGLGTHNQYSRRVFWPLGGSCNAPGRVWRLSAVGQSKIAWIECDCDIEMGSV